MSEFSLINRYCHNLGVLQSETAVSVGDDGAVVNVPEGYQMVVSVDTMVEGVHFFSDVAPQRLAYKLLAVNASDIAAMGGVPKWAVLALTLPNRTDDWLEAFFKGLHQAAQYFGVEIIGGDTTHGALTLSLTVMGVVKKNHGLRRCDAKVGDNVFVTGCVGDASLALTLMTDPQGCENQNRLIDTQLIDALEYPLPPVRLGPALVGIARSAIDISDGLLADLTHIAKASDVSIALNADQIPLSKKFNDCGGDLVLALSGGDDYQLAFTAAEDVSTTIFQLGEKLAVSITQIGTVIKRDDAPPAVVVLDADGKNLSFDLEQLGYDHF